jgi:hypothetical protein
MKGIEADLPDLIKRLKPLMEIDTVKCSDNLKERLHTLKECVICSSFQPSIDAPLSIP